MTNRGREEHSKKDAMSWCCCSAVADCPALLRVPPVVGLDEIDELPRGVVVVGSDADLATVLTRLLRADRLDVEVAHVAVGVDRRAARVSGVATGFR